MDSHDSLLRLPIVTIVRRPSNPFPHSLLRTSQTTVIVAVNNKMMRVRMDESRSYISVQSLPLLLTKAHGYPPRPKTA